MPRVASTQHLTDERQKRSSRQISFALLPVLAQQRDRPPEKIARRAPGDRATDDRGRRRVMRIDRGDDRDGVLQGEHRNIADERHHAARGV